MKIKITKDFLQGLAVTRITEAWNL